jgi:hypothetical protein
VSLCWISSPSLRPTPELGGCSPRTVLVLTGSEDLTADAVISEITRRGIPGRPARLGRLPGPRVAEHYLRQQRPSGRIIGPDTITNLDEVVAVYYRRPSRFTFLPGYVRRRPRLRRGRGPSRHGRGTRRARLSLGQSSPPHRTGRVETTAAGDRPSGRAGHAAHPDRQ